MLREVWLNIRVDTYEGVAVKVLLGSRATRMLIDKKMAAKHSFRLQKLKRLLMVKNINRTYHSEGAIIYQVEVNVERMKIDVSDLGKTDIILGIP